ncbi:MAG: methionine synthase [Pseudomonadota bacterium]
MRILSVLFWILTVIVAGLWVVGYIYLVAMACAFGSPNASSCRTPAPWELTGEDLQIMVLIPFSILAVCVVIAIWTGRAARRASG